MVFDFKCFASLLANNKSCTCASVGASLVTVFAPKSPKGDLPFCSPLGVRGNISKSCAITPFSKDLNCFAGKSNSFCFSKILFFFFISICSASASKAGAINTSKNNLSISVAVASSIVAFVISTPPNADTGSAASAAFQASTTVGLVATPQALVCFNTAKVVSLNSAIKCTAASISTRLL